MKLLSIASRLLVTCLAMSLPTGAQTLVVSEDFEAGFPGSWTVGNSGNGPTWSDVTAVFGGEGTHSGSWKGYCAGTAHPHGSPEANPLYENKMAAFMETGFSLRGCENRVLLRFWSKLPSIETCCDSARVLVNGTVVWSNAAPQTAWTEVTLDLSAYVGGFCTLRFEFHSDSTVVAEGWYLDDITVMGYDTLAPVVTCSGNLLLAADPGQCSRSNVTFTATASDNCPGVAVDCNPPSGSTFPAGVTVVTCIAKDAAGNLATCSFSVTVVEAPVILCPTNVTVMTCSNVAAVSFAAVASNRCYYPPACAVPDNGMGTADLPPPGCQYTGSGNPMLIVDGLPPGTTIEMPPILHSFTCGTGAVGVCSFPPTPGFCMAPGGTLGGEHGCSGATLSLNMAGTGTLLGFNRSISIPVGLETHIGPRPLGAPLQSFSTVLYRFFGQILADPDFDLLRITAGTDFGLPSPGHTVITAAPGGSWAVDSYFDMVYRVDFVGRPGGALAGRSGSTTGMIRIWTGGVPPPVVTYTPPSGSLFPLGTTLVTCVASNVWGQTSSCQFPVTVQTDTRPPELFCPPAVVAQTCSNSLPVEFFVTASNHCAHGAHCLLPDNGSGTADFPPVSCQYVSPLDPLFIIDGLPAGTAIRMPLLLGGFSCGSSGGLCSFTTTPGNCRITGGLLGGGRVCSQASMALSLLGTGTLASFNRAITLPVEMEFHTAPRPLGSPVQNFATLLFRFFGQITTDPDFDLLRITAGTDFGMPSPGQTTLTRQPDGTWAVDSHFDVTYRVDFVGKAGGPLAGMSGSTTGTNRWRTGAGVFLPVISSPPPGSQFPVGTTWVTSVSSNAWGTNICTFPVTVTAMRPSLAVSPQGTNLLLRWPEACSTYQLQAAAHLNPPVPWIDVANPPAHVGAEWQVLVSPSPATQFFRLRLLP